MSISASKAALKTTLRAKLKEFSDNTDQDKNPDEAISEFVELLVDELEAWIKTATITVNTTVVGTSPSGPVTGQGIGNGTIS